MLAYIPYMDPMGYVNYISDDANMAWNIVHKSLARRNILWNSSWVKWAEMQDNASHISNIQNSLLG